MNLAVLSMCMPWYSCMPKPGFWEVLVSATVQVPLPPMPWWPPSLEMVRNIRWPSGLAELGPAGTVHPTGT